MVFNNNLLLGASGAGGYTIDQSIRFNDNDSPYLYRTPGSDGDTTAFTISAWVKRANITSLMNIYCGYDSGGPASGELRLNGSALQFYDNNGTGNGLLTNALFRDPSAWYHIVAVWDTDNATSTDRLRLYVNGERITSFSSSTYPASGYATTYFNRAAYQQRIGYTPSGGGTYSDCYMAEYHFIDGQSLDPSSFGEVNADTGQWIAKEYSGSYGTNGFYITGEDSADLGADYSGNGNDFTSSGLTSADQMSDSPTNNWCVLSPLSSPLTRSSAMSEGNLKWRNTSDGTSFYIGCAATQRALGKCYWEVTNTYDGTGSTRTGLFPRGFLIQNDYPGGAFGADCIGLIAATGRVDRNGVVGTTYTGADDDDVNMFAFDEDAGKLWIGLNGTWFNSGDPAAGTGEVAGSIVQSPLFPATSGYGTSSGNFQEFNFGQSAFAHTVPTGFLPLDSSSLPDPTIADPSAYFQPTLYAGNGTAIGSGGLEVNQSENSTFQPDFVWIKNRSAADNHMLYDSVRGATKDLHSNAAAAEVTDTEGLSTFDTDGFTVGSNVEVNTNAENYVAWQWYAPTTSTNTDGSVSSTLSVDQTSGLSIGTFDGTGANLTAGHGLGVAPDFIMATVRPNAANWNVYHSAIGNTGALRLNLSNAISTSAQYWNNTSPTSTVITFGTNSSSNSSGNSTIFYAFTEVEGYSAFGSYEGNANVNGPMVNLGFKPAWVMIKNADATGSWLMFDTERDTYNAVHKLLYAQLSNVEDTSTVYLDIVSNGFKIRSTGNGTNNAVTYIYAAFAESPFKSTNAR